MADDPSEPPADRPEAPELPAYVLDPLENQSPERLEAIASYARALAGWKRQAQDSDAAERRESESVDEADVAALAERGVSTDPADYDEVPTQGAYITVKETKPGYRYYYWQWREGDSWKNRYICPVESSE
ncbi:hypothetical protein [Haloarchaeobius sp. HME9146]|uniref:hypothetical protein n=1 Tax=Haloarchaeobius sp. HME9146 TaxID=2978732 RepID=UPI0021C0BFAF|nr:hypothetical protein [Haloarchaeobius sp. HME9146]MCT9098402.1 hypothetical protein [Haloarchaeobius sp. HME9146]